MCEATYHIKLCTCGEGQIDEDRCWRLIRTDPDGEMLIGMIEPPMHTLTSIYVGHKLLDDLNGCKVFDFDYEPKLGDVIEITLDGNEFAYEYTGTKFTIAPIDYHFSHTLSVAKGSVSL